MTQNFASRHLDDAQWAAVDQAIDSLNAALEPLLVALASEQRRRAVKMGDGSEAFCRQALDVISENIALMPRNFHLDEMRRDLASHDALHARTVRLPRLMEKVHDTATALGSDAMVAALEGYAFLKAAGKAKALTRCASCWASDSTTGRARWRRRQRWRKQALRWHGSPVLFAGGFFVAGLGLGPRARGRG